MNKIRFLITILLINSAMYGSEIFGTVKKIQGVAMANDKNLTISDNVFVMTI